MRNKLCEIDYLIIIKIAESQLIQVLGHFQSAVNEFCIKKEINSEHAFKMIIIAIYILINIL